MKTISSRERRRRKQRNQWIIISIVILMGIAMLTLACKFFGSRVPAGKEEKREPDFSIEGPLIEEQLLTPNEYSRPGIPLSEVNGIVIHYTANPGTTAQGNRNYFESLKTTQTTKASSHFIIGLEGEIIQCIPLNEIAYASNDRNSDTISIECCHPRKDGKFTKETMSSLIELTAWLSRVYGLEKEDIIRHYDVTGKNCPKYFVEHEKKWKSFKKKVFAYIKKQEKLEAK